MPREYSIQCGGGPRVPRRAAAPHATYIHSFLLSRQTEANGARHTSSPCPNWRKPWCCHTLHVAHVNPLDAAASSLAPLNEKTSYKQGC